MVAPLTARHLAFIAAREDYVAEFGKWPTLAEMGRRLGISRTRAGQIAIRIARWEKWNADAPIRAEQAERTMRRLYLESICRLIGKAAEKHAKAREKRDQRVAWLVERQAEIDQELAMLRRKRTLRTTLDLVAAKKRELVRRRERGEFDHSAHVHTRNRFIDRRLAAIARQREEAYRIKEAKIQAELDALAAAGLATPIRFVRDTIFTIQTDGYWYPFPHLRVEPIE